MEKFKALQATSHVMITPLFDMGCILANSRLKLAVIPIVKHHTIVQINQAEWHERLRGKIKVLPSHHSQVFCLYTSSMES